MNFQAVRQANGKNVTMEAVATVIDGTTHIPSGTPKQECKFADKNGEQQSVTIWQGKGTPLPLDRQGQTLSINISCKAGRDNRMRYGGFWQQQAPQNAPQSPQNVPESPNAPQSDQSARESLVIAYITAGKEPEIQLVNYWAEYIKTGKAPIPPGQEQQNEQADDIPWEQG